MDFDFSDEQRQLHDAVRSFLAKEHPFERSLAIKRSGSGWDPALWRGLADLGVTAINVPAELGGLGYGPQETIVVDGCVRPDPAAGTGSHERGDRHRIAQPICGCGAGRRYAARHGPRRAHRGRRAFRIRWALRRPSGRRARPSRRGRLPLGCAQGRGPACRDGRYLARVGTDGGRRARPGRGGAVHGVPRHAGPAARGVLHRRRPARRRGSPAGREAARSFPAGQRGRRPAGDRSRLRHRSRCVVRGGRRHHAGGC